MEWVQHFNAREQAEIGFAKQYVRLFDHGTDGHSRLHVIAKLADLLNQYEQKLQEGRQEEGKVEAMD